MKKIYSTKGRIYKHSQRGGMFMFSPALISYPFHSLLWGRPSGAHGQLLSKEITVQQRSGRAPESHRLNEWLQVNNSLKEWHGLWWNDKKMAVRAGETCRLRGKRQREGGWLQYSMHGWLNARTGTGTPSHAVSVGFLMRMRNKNPAGYRC